MYPAYNQEDPDSPNCEESSAYPAAPDSEYGWEKLFSERLYLTYPRYGMSRGWRGTTTFSGPKGPGLGGREKAPAALVPQDCRPADGGAIEIWGDGLQTRSFLYVSECIEGTLRLMRSGFQGPVNIGSEEMVTIDRLADMIMTIAGKHVEKRPFPAPSGSGEEIRITA